VSDIVAFVMARMEEREAAIRDNVAWWWDDFDRIEVHTSTGVVGGGEQYVAPFLDPAHVLAEVAAKRAIVAEHAITYRHIGWLEEGEEEGTELPVCGRCVSKHSHYASRAVVPEGPCRTVKFLALPYADHPDYDVSWRP
jgi:hypothetical protein